MVTLDRADNSGEDDDAVPCSDRVSVAAMPARLCEVYQARPWCRDKSSSVTP